MRAVYDDKNTRGYIETCHHYFNDCGSGMYLPQLRQRELPKAKHDELKKLRALELEQKARRDKLRSSLKSIASSTTTRKALAAALPEFEKYLPAEAQTTRNLPVIANVVTDFMEAGWPKDKAAQASPA